MNKKQHELNMDWPPDDTRRLAYGFRGRNEMPLEILYEESKTRTKVRKDQERGVSI